MAVRNENNEFWLCIVSSDVYEKENQAIIRWLSPLTESQSIYTLDHKDCIPIKSILTKVEARRLRKDKFVITKEERNKIIEILKESLEMHKMPSSNKPKIISDIPVNIPLKPADYSSDDSLGPNVARDPWENTKKKKGKLRKHNDKSNMIESIFTGLPITGVIYTNNLQVPPISER